MAPNWLSSETPGSTFWIGSLVLGPLQSVKTSKSSPQIERISTAEIRAVSGQAYLTLQRWTIQLGAYLTGRTIRSVLTHGSPPKISASLSVDRDDDPTEMRLALVGYFGSQFPCYLRHTYRVACNDRRRCTFRRWSLQRRRPEYQRGFTVWPDFSFSLECSPNLLNE